MRSLKQTCDAKQDGEELVVHARMLDELVKEGIASTVSRASSTVRAARPGMDTDEKLII